MIASTQITNAEFFAFIAVQVFKLLSRKILLINREDNRNCWEAGYFLRKHTLFHKEYFYKQRQAEIGKKSSKSQTTPWGWNFIIWKLFTFFIHIITQT